MTRFALALFALLLGSCSFDTSSFQHDSAVTVDAHTFIDGSSPADTGTNDGGAPDGGDLGDGGGTITDASHDGGSTPDSGSSDAELPRDSGMDSGSEVLDAGGVICTPTGTYQFRSLVDPFSACGSSWDASHHNDTALSGTSLVFMGSQGPFLPATISQTNVCEWRGTLRVNISFGPSFSCIVTLRAAQMEVSCTEDASRRAPCEWVLEKV